LVFARADTIIGMTIEMPPDAADAAHRVEREA